MTRNSQSQLGLSLIELMISVFLSLFILLCCIGIFLFYNQTYQYHRAISGIQENGRYAVNMLNEDIRAAGYFGCARTEDATITNNTHNE